jgi:hypothetical protein
LQPAKHPSQADNCLICADAALGGHDNAVDVAVLGRGLAFSTTLRPKRHRSTIDSRTDGIAKPEVVPQTIPSVWEERSEVKAWKTKLLCYYQREAREDIPMSVLLRPLTLGELLDRAFQLYRSRFTLLVSISAVAYLPVFVIQAGMLWAPKTFSVSASMAMVGGFLVALVVRLLGVAAANSATVIVVSAAYLERPITLREAYARVSGMLVRVFFIMIGAGIGIALGLLLLIVPGVILFLMWALAIPVAVLEDAGLGESLSRSRYLTAGHRSRVFVIYLLYFVLVFALEFALLTPLGAMIALKGHGPAGAAATAPIVSAASAVLTFVIESLITPILAICLSLMYYDERVRKEAFDIQLMMSALGEGQVASATAAS